jgi:hypothetical protein
VRRAGPLVSLAFLAALVLAALAGADTTDPKKKIAKADQAFATASVLKFSDLGPAWKGGAEAATSLKIPVCPGDQPNNADLTLTGHAESVLQLTSDGLLVDTDVEIFKSTKQVDRLFGRMTTPKLAGCLQYDLLKSVGGTGAKVGKVTQVGVAKAGTHVSDFRVALSYNGHPVVSDYLFVSQGRSQFFVNVVAPGPLESQLVALENRIAKTLAGRGAA